MTEHPTGPGGQRRRPRVALVFGGRSSEHSVSCVSAGSVLDVLDRDAWDLVAIGITESGRWVRASDDPRDWTIEGDKLPSVPDRDTALALVADPTRPGLLADEAAGSAEPVQVDVVFPLLHGPYGEDGTIQGLLELAGVPYVGSGVLASAAAMDKAVMKVLLAGAGLPVGPYVVVGPGEWERDPAGAAARVVDALRFPVFVKPARGGSSVGISRVADAAELPRAIEEARRHDPKVVVEQGIAGREVECGVLDRAGDGPEASVPAEIRVRGEHAFYDFDAKYLDGADLDVPADLPDGVADAVRAAAVRAFVALGCEGLARVDFFLAADGSLVVNEVNTMPASRPRRCSRACGRPAGSATPSWSTCCCAPRSRAAPDCAERRCRRRAPRLRRGARGGHGTGRARGARRGRRARRSGGGAVAVEVGTARSTAVAPSTRASPAGRDAPGRSPTGRDASNGREPRAALRQALRVPVDALDRVQLRRRVDRRRRSAAGQDDVVPRRGVRQRGACGGRLLAVNKGGQARSSARQAEATVPVGDGGVTLCAVAAQADSDPSTAAPRTVADSAARAVRAGTTARSEVDDGTGRRPGDPRHALDLRDHELAELVNVVGLGAHDDVVRPGDVLGERHAGDGGDVEP